MFQPSTRRTIERLLPFALIWLISGWIFMFVEAAATASFEEVPASVIDVTPAIFVFASVAIMGVGALMGWIEFNYLDRLFLSKKFLIRVGYKLLIYASAIFTIILILFPVAASLELNTSVLDRRVWTKYLVYLKSITFLSTIVQLTVALILSLLYSEISDFIGQRVLLSFFTGKYHTPVEEERIFMFLDMKSSTTIAERLGHVNYFNFLRAYYRSFTAAIVKHEGEVYQYVGDEIILSWKVGDDQAQRAMACFFAMQESLAEKRDWFTTHFGLAPSFKAGVHLGPVTTGEIGVLRKEIMFSGDVLNATARIQSRCNDYGVDLLVSEDLANQLNGHSPYELTFLDRAELKGKKTKIRLYTARLPSA